MVGYQAAFRDERMTVKEVRHRLEEFDDDEVVMFHHKMHGKIMPEEIWCHIVDIEYTTDGVLLKGNKQ